MFYRYNYKFMTQLKIDKMEELQCSNCGSKNIAEVNGIANCLSCGTNYPEMPLKKIDIDEELKKEK